MFKTSSKTNKLRLRERRKHRTKYIDTKHILHSITNRSNKPQAQPASKTNNTRAKHQVIITQTTQMRDTRARKMYIDTFTPGKQAGSTAPAEAGATNIVPSTVTEIWRQAQPQILACFWPSLAWGGDRFPREIALSSNNGPAKLAG